MNGAPSERGENSGPARTMQDAWDKRQPDPDRAPIPGAFIELEDRVDEQVEDLAPDRSPQHDVLARRLTELNEWRRKLLAAVRIQQLLEVLSDLGFNERDFLKVMPGLSARSLRRWRREGPPASKAAVRWENVDDFRSIVGFFLADGTYDEDGIVAWCRSRQKDLGLERPLDVLGQSRFEDVLKAAERAVRPLPGETGHTVAPPQPKGVEKATDNAPAK